jgi:hypothetical protein
MMFKSIIAKAVKQIVAPAQPEFRSVVWALTVDMSHEREGFGAGWCFHSFTTPSAANLALLEIQDAMKIFVDVLEDDLIQRRPDRVAKIENSKQWRDLCRRYPEWFGKTIEARSLQYLEFDVVEMPLN